MGAGMRVLFVALLACSSAAAQPFPPRSTTGGDEFHLEIVSPTLMYFHYYNAYPPRTGSHGRQHIEDGDMRVEFVIRGTSGPEIISVMPPPGWVVYPPTASVIDGDTFVFELFRESGPSS